MEVKEQINKRLNALAKSSFRSRFHLSIADKDLIAKKGRGVIRKHGEVMLKKRLFPPAPPNDGKQTPFKGHPVFAAQHATATCCRKCLLKWYHFPLDHQLNKAEQEYILGVIDAWINRELA